MGKSKKLLILIAIFLATFMTSVEVTIVSTAMPTIISDLKGLEIQSWVFSVYLLSSAVTTPIYGKLADNIGRKRIFMFGLLMFLLGSFLCGFAPNMLTLIIFRLIQGIGAGAVMPLTFTIIADLFDFDERAKVMAMTNSAWAISALVGPLIGGIIVQTLGWHWVFFINVPLGIITILLTMFGYKDVHQSSGKQPLDTMGASSLAVSLVSLLFVFQMMSGSQINWLLEVILVLIFIGSTIIFVKTEKKTKDPIIQLSMFANRQFTVQILITTLLSGALIGFNNYFPIWLQSVYHTSAVIAGVVLTPSSVLWTISSFFVGYLMSRYASKHVFTLILVVLLVSYIGLVFAGPTFPIIWLYVISGITGAAMGIVITINALLAQKMVSKDNIGQASSMVVLGRTIGQAVMTGIFGLIFSLGISAGLKKYQSISFEQVNDFISSSTAGAISNDIRPQLDEIVLIAIHAIFWVTLLLFLLTLIINLLDKKTSDDSL